MARAGKPQVAVSVFPLFDLVRRVAGASGPEVELLLPGGGHAHEGGLAARQVARLSEVRLVVGVGPGFDGWALDAARRAGAEPEPLWLGGGEPLADPHVWLDPLRMREALGELARALARLDPAGADGHRTRAEQLAAALSALDAQLQSRSDRWRGRRVVTDHPFLGAFAQRYGPEVVGVLEQEPGRELTPRRLSTLLAELGQRRDVAAILVATGEESAAARVAAEETQLPLARIDIAGGAGADRYEAVLLSVADALDAVLG